jgi:hypothetical protein
MTARRRLCAASATLALLGAGLAGCGHSENAYCRALKSQQSVFEDDGTGLQLIDNLPKLRALAAKAPDDLDDEWQAVLAALDSLHDAIAKAGVKPQDFVDGKPPASLSTAQRARIAAAASMIASADVVQAIDGIDQEARDVCKLQLGL